MFFIEKGIIQISVNKRIKSIKRRYINYNISSFISLIQFNTILKPSLKIKTASQYYSGLQRQLPGYGQKHQSF